MNYDIPDFLRNQPLFSLIRPEKLDRLVTALTPAHVTIGQPILQEGEVADALFLVAQGRVRIHCAGLDGKPLTLDTLGSGELFGEIALLTNGRRTASARAIEESRLLRLDRTHFNDLIASEPRFRSALENLSEQRNTARFFRTSTFLRVLPANEVTRLVSDSQNARFTDGQCIVRQGKRGQQLFVLRSGQTHITQTDGNGREILLGTIGPGDHFGESFPGHIIADGETECVVFGRAQFDSLREEYPKFDRQMLTRMPPCDVVQPRQPARDNAGNVSEPPQQETAVTIPKPHPKEPWTRPHASRLWSWSDPMVFQQDEADCGAACLAMVGRHHGLRLSLEQCRAMLGNDASGASAVSIIRVAESLGFECQAIESDLDRIDRTKLPAIVHCGWHYVVLYDISQEFVRVGDPAQGLLRLRRDAFEQSWSGRLLLLAPTPDLTTPTSTCSTWGLMGRELRSGLRNVFVRVVPLTAGWLASILLLVFAVGRLCRAWFAGEGNVIGWMAAICCCGTASVVCLVARNRVLDRFLLTVCGNLTERLFALRTVFATEYHQAKSFAHRLGRLELSPHFLGSSHRALGSVLSVSAIGAGMAWFALIPIEFLMIHGALVLVVITWIGASTSTLVRLKQQLTAVEVLARSVRFEALSEAGLLQGTSADERLVMRNRESCAMAHQIALRWRRFTVSLQLAVGIANLLDVLITLFLAVPRYQNGNLDIESLASIAGLTGLIIWATRHWVDSWPDAVVVWCEWQKINETLECEPPPQKEKLAPSTRPVGLIRFQGVDFRSTPDSPESLRYLTCQIEPGGVTWVVGRSGAGKTSLGLLLDGRYVQQSGKITLDGMDLRELVPWFRNRHLHRVGEDSALIPGTISENIALFRPDATCEEVTAIASRIGIHEDITRLPLGYGTVVGATAGVLSPRQRQRVCLARSLLAQPTVLILDEITTTMTHEEMKVLLPCVREVMSRGTTIICTSRPGPSQPTDRVIVLEQGRAMEQGTHEKLAAQTSLYRLLLGS